MPHGQRFGRRRRPDGPARGAACRALSRPLEPSRVQQDRRRGDRQAVTTRPHEPMSPAVGALEDRRGQHHQGF
jgi:hypothetical protein